MKQSTIRPSLRLCTIVFFTSITIAVLGLLVLSRKNEHQTDNLGFIENHGSAHSPINLQKNVNAHGKKGVVAGSHGGLNTKTGYAVLDEFNAIQGDVTPEMARKLLDRCKSEIVDLDERWRLSSRIISALCRSGYSKEAWLLIEQAPGDVRAGELGAFFGTGSLKFERLSEYLDELSNPEDRANALSGFINRLPSERLNEFDFSKIAISSPREKNTVFSAIRMSVESLGPSSKIPDATKIVQNLLETSAQLVIEHKLDSEHLSRILQADLSNDGFYHWNFLNEMRGGVSAEEFEKLQASVIPGMIKANAARAMDTLLSDPSAAQSGFVVSRAIESWYRVDSTGANAWVTSHLANQDVATRDLILGSVARVATQDGDYTTALQWSNQITDAKRKQYVETN